MKLPEKHVDIKEGIFNVDLFEELNILGRDILNKPNETKNNEK
jgi:hypothetical protein